MKAFSLKEFCVDEALRSKLIDGHSLSAEFEDAFSFYVRDRKSSELLVARLLCEMLTEAVTRGKDANWILCAYAAFWIYRLDKGAVILSLDHPLYSDQLIGDGAAPRVQLQKLLKLEPVRGARDDKP